MKPDVRKARSVVLACIFAFGILPHVGEAADERQTLQALSKTFAGIAREVGKTVVGIKTERSDEDRDRGRRESLDPKFRRPFEREFRRWFRRNSDEGEDNGFRFRFRAPDRFRQEHYGLPEGVFPRDLPDYANFGSGILLDKQGHIVTVIDLVNDSAEIFITLHDGSRLDAEAIGSDKETGLAVIKVDVDALPTTKFGDSDQVEIGELMIAVGYSADQAPAVFFGMISGVERNPRAVSYESWIEIDANLRPGSGGGAVVNTNGEIIGMSVANPPGGAFAVPINTVRHIAAELIEHGQVTRGWLGVMIQEIDSELAEKLGLDKPMGVLVTDVVNNTPAEKAGLQEGDVIAAIEGKAIKNLNHLRYTIAMYKPDSTISITFMRDGEKRDISATLGERSMQALRQGRRKNADWKGLSLQNLTEDLAEEFEGYAPNEGVLITRVESGSLAAKAGEGGQKLCSGDLIVEVEHQPVHSVEEFKSAVKKVEGKVLLQVKRGEQGWFVVVE